MRRICFSLCASALFLSASAIDRVVSASGLFPTIGEALLASSDGDRILVEPGTYSETLSISKSITILANQEGARPVLNGAIDLRDADGKRVMIMGMKLSANISRTGVYASRTEFKLLDSRLQGILSMVDPYIHVELLRDTIDCQVSFSCGSAIGNDVLGCAGGVAAIIVQGNTSLPDEVYVVGNSIGALNPGLGISITSDLRFHVENNYVRGLASYPAISVQRNNVLPVPAYSSILNNTLYRSTASAGAAVQAGIPNVRIRNNAIVGYSSTAGAFDLIVAASAINASTGAPSGGSPLINAGDPDPRYLDLDLTTNDVGCYGGSNSRVNFTTPMGSAVVGFMQAPRVVAQGDAVNISATGFDR